MKDNWINTINKWCEYFNKRDNLEWNYVISNGTIILGERKSFTSADIKIENILNVLEESCELIFQLKDGQSVSFLGYQPKINFYTT